MTTHFWNNRQHKIADSASIFVYSETDNKSIATVTVEETEYKHMKLQCNQKILKG